MTPLHGVVTDDDLDALRKRNAERIEKRIAKLKRMGLYVLDQPFSMPRNDSVLMQHMQTFQRPQPADWEGSGDG